MERRRFAAMGSTAEILVVGDVDAAALDGAVRRIDELERRWSRFVDTSEVSALNRSAGRPVAVSDDTVLLVRLACDAWRRTGGCFDPTVLGAVEAIGYTCSLVGPLADPRSGRVDRPSNRTGTGTCGEIVVDRVDRTVRLPERTGFDPGGIGKGLAADLVSHDLVSEGASGGCVNIGGDLRVWGPGPGGRPWRIGIGERTVEITDVGVATSGTDRRSWFVDDELVHHLIDPLSGQPAADGPTRATVVAGSAWRAETCATALLAGPLDAVDTHADGWGVRALVA